MQGREKKEVYGIAKQTYIFYARVSRQRLTIRD